MKEKILNHVNKKEKLSEKLDFLTALYLWTNKPEVQDACEMVRFELCKTGDDEWFCYPSRIINGGHRVDGGHEFTVYRNGLKWGTVLSKKEVRKLMELYK